MQIKNRQIALFAALITAIAILLWIGTDAFIHLTKTSVFGLAYEPGRSAKLTANSTPRDQESDVIDRQKSPSSANRQSETVKNNGLPSTATRAQNSLDSIDHQSLPTSANRQSEQVDNNAQRRWMRNLKGLRALSLALFKALHKNTILS